MMSFDGAKFDGIFFCGFGGTSQDCQGFGGDVSLAGKLRD